jgi:flavin-dependent dehydrogenase
VGEYFVCNALTTSGECDIMIFEAIPGGPADTLDMRVGPEQYLKDCLDVLGKFYPHEAERCQNIELTDDLGILTGRFPPTIRKPLMQLPGGGLAMGIADAVCLNDPITGQGSCNAAKFAKAVYDAVLNRGHEAFDGQWMQGVFNSYWQQAEAVVAWTNHLLDGPGPAASKLLMAAGSNQDVADFLLRGMDDANRLMPYFLDEAAADELIARLMPLAA